ncbi:hypothetical protein WJX79_007326 [Trebouxia sp. C0005]
MLFSKVEVKARKRTPRTKRCRNSTFAALDFFRRKIATSGAVDDILAVLLKEQEMTRLCSIRAFQPPGNFCGRQRRKHSSSSAMQICFGPQLVKSIRS